MNDKNQNAPVPYVDSNTLEVPSEHCCIRMTSQLRSTIADEDKSSIVCVPHPVRYGILDRNGDSMTGIDYCPWCGTALSGADDSFKLSFPIKGK